MIGKENVIPSHRKGDIPKAEYDKPKASRYTITVKARCVAINNKTQIISMSTAKVTNGIKFPPSIPQHNIPIPSISLLTSNSPILSEVIVFCAPSLFPHL